MDDKYDLNDLMRRGLPLRLEEAEDMRPLEDSSGPVAVAAQSEQSLDVLPKSERRRSLLEEIHQCAELFRTPEGVPYLAVREDGAQKTWPLRSKQARGWVASFAYRRMRAPLADKAHREVMLTLEGEALNEGPVCEVHVRVAQEADAIYLDLANEQGEVVKLTKDDWSVMSARDAPVRFRSSQGSRPLPRPVRGGNLEDLRPLLNVPNDDTWYLIVGWLVGILCPDCPMPLLVLQGEQGSAKSTTAYLLRALVDPAKPMHRAPPKNEQDIAIAARNSRVLAYDNLSVIPPWLSDALCRLATGGGFGTRTLYADEEETLFDARRPLVLTGITDLLGRPDLADRALLVELPTIAEHRRQDEQRVREEFERLHPALLGALCDAVCAMLRHLPEVRERLQSPPRMADFAQRVSAAEAALGWPSGSFLAAYRANRAETAAQSLESDPVATSVCALLESLPQHCWRGTTQDLLRTLTGLQKASGLPADWPRTARGLTSRLKRAAPVLRACGIDVGRTVPTGHARQRLLELKRRDDGPEPSAPSAPSAEDPSGRNDS